MYGVTPRQGQPARPYIAPPVNEGSSVSIAYQGVGPAGQSAISALQYKVDNLTANRNMLQWTEVETPGSSGTISIPASLNTMTERSVIERHLIQVTVECTYADGRVVTSPAHYELCTLRAT